MSDDLSRSYKTQDEAAMGGFKRIMGGNYPNKLDEFAFYVILVVNNGQPNFHYTPPQKLGPNGGEIKWKLARGQFLRAYCHTHPARIIEENFGSDDKEEFKRKLLIHPFLAWYLLTPKEQIRFARSETDFPAGNPVGWIASVKP